METTNERRGRTQRRLRSDRKTKRLNCADSNRLPRYAFGMKSQKYSLFLVCVALFGSLFVPSVSCAQQAGTSPVSIRVTDPTGMGIAHAMIRMCRRLIRRPQKWRQTKSWPAWHFGLKTGGYALFASAPGFKSAATHIDVQGTKEVQTVPVRLEIRW